MSSAMPHLKVAWLENEMPSNLHKPIVARLETITTSQMASLETKYTTHNWHGHSDISGTITPKCVARFDPKYPPLVRI